MSGGPKRFQIALSFPGEHRAFVKQIADLLAAKTGRKRVLYDRYYEAEFARPDLDTYLQGLYHDESELTAVFLCAEYEKKEWCGLEWRAIRDLIKSRRTDEVMLFRFDMVKIPGLFSTDGYVWIKDRSPQEVAKLILQRHTLNSGGQTHEPNATGPVRVKVDRLPPGGRHFVARQDELRRLDDAWADEQTDALSIVAWGGVGKSALVDEWLKALRTDGWRGARRVYGWSFYSQGTEDRLTSADVFIDDALTWFGDADPSAGSPRDRGLRLAELVRRERTLLVLDGVEPLQHPPGPIGWRLKDPALAALVKSLARSNNGLLVISTRETVDDIANLEDASAPRLDRLASHRSLRALARRTGRLPSPPARLVGPTRRAGRPRGPPRRPRRREPERRPRRPGRPRLERHPLEPPRLRPPRPRGSKVRSTVPRKARPARARERLDAAAELVERCGYGRRRPDLEFLEGVLRERS